MTTIHLTVRGAHVEARLDGPLTSGMAGLPVVISYDSSWEGLTKTLYCRNSMGKTAFDQVYTLANIGSHATVAPEVMQAHRNLYLGIQGHNPDGTLVVPTIWANCGLIQPGAEGSGEESQAATPEVWQQLASQIGTLEELDTTRQGNLVAAINELSQEAEASRETLGQEISQVRALCNENSTNLAAAKQQLETGIANVHNQLTGDFNLLNERITQHRFDAASADAELRTYIQNSKYQLENKIAALESGTGQVPGSVVGMEPELDDIPQVFLEGDIPADQEETQATLYYCSRTASFSAYLTLTCAQDTSLGQEKKSFLIRMFSDADRTAPLPKAFRDWDYASNSYVLRSNFTDHSHARNIVVSRIWNEVMANRDDYASLPAQLRESPRNGATDGFPVKVYINHNYQGIYTWNMGAARWNIQNPNQGVLRALTNSTSDSMHTPCTFQALWSGTSGDHWSVEAGSVETLAPSLNALIAFVMESDDEQFQASLDQYLDVQSAIDYYLLQYAVCGVNSLGKNLHLVTYDGIKWFCSCGDQDASFLLDVTGATFLPPTLQIPLDFKERISLLWKRLDKTFTQALLDRYQELRSHVLSFSNICRHFEQFMAVIDPSIYQEDGEIFDSIPLPDANNIRQIRNAIRDRLSYCDDLVEIMGGISIYDEIEYDLNPLATVTWYDDKYYLNGVMKDKTGDHCTSKFALQDCLYCLKFPTKYTFPTLYMWDADGVFVGQIENQLAYFTGIPGYQYAFYLRSVDEFDASLVTIMPVNNVETAKEPFTLNLAELEYTVDSTGIVANISDLFTPKPTSRDKLATRINHANTMVVLGDSYCKPNFVDPEKLLVVTLYYHISTGEIRFGTRQFSTSLEDAMNYFTEHNSIICINQ